MKKINNCRGFSLVSVLVAAVLSSIVLAGSMSIIKIGQRGLASQESGEQVTTLMRTVRENLDCRSTLGVTASTVLPLSCDATADFSLKRRDGNQLTDANDKLGEWTLKGRCIDAADPHLTVLRSRGREDALTNRQYTQPRDLFKGTARFCQEFFIPMPPPPPSAPPLTPPSAPPPAPPPASPPAPPTTPPQSDVGKFCRCLFNTSGANCVADCAGQPCVEQCSDSLCCYEGPNLPPYQGSLMCRESCGKCLPGNALVETPDGTVPAREILPGMLVWSLTERGERVAAIVAKIGSVAVPPEHRMFRLELEDGRQVQASAGHPMADGVSIERIVPGQMYDGSRVQKVERIPYEGMHTYDLLPAGDTGVYFIDGIPMGSTLD